MIYSGSNLAINFDDVVKNTGRRIIPLYDSYVIRTEIQSLHLVVYVSNRYCTLCENDGCSRMVRTSRNGIESQHGVFLLEEFHEAEDWRNTCAKPRSAVTYYDSCGCGTKQHYMNSWHEIHACSSEQCGTITIRGPFYMFLKGICIEWGISRNTALISIDLRIKRGHVQCKMDILTSFLSP